MPRSSIATYAGPEEMEAAHIGAHAEIIPTGNDPFMARSVRVELDYLWATRADEQGSRIKHVLLDPRRAFITFETGPGPTRVVEGVDMAGNTLMLHSVGEAFYERSRGAAHWGSVSMPVDHFSLLAAQVGCRCPVPSPKAVVTTPPPDRLERFHRLHAAAAALAESAPEVIAQPAAARGLEQALIEATLGCLDAGEAESQKWAQQCHSIIMRRFRRVLEQQPDHALYVPEICAAIGVPERTLRLCCQEHLGMSPKHYLTLRRMNLARRALLASSPGKRTVTDIATSYGFWHFGRFSAVYRSLFNELPSDSLSRMLH